MSKRLSGIPSLAYKGVEAPTPPNVNYEDRQPTVNDRYNYNIGDFWVRKNPQELWYLASLANKQALWIQLYPGGSPGGADQFPCDIGTANEVGGVLNIFGGTGVVTTGFGNTVTISANLPSTKVTIFNASDIWVKDPNTKFITFYMWNGGDGGGSGRRGASGSSSGGGGGAGGSVIRYSAPAIFFDAFEFVTIGAGGAGGVAQTVNNTNGNDGALGGSSGFGSYVIPQHAAAGSGGNMFGGGPSSTTFYHNNDSFITRFPDGVNRGYIGHTGGSGLPASGTAAFNQGTRANGTSGEASFNSQYLAGGGGGGGGADSITPRTGGNGGGMVALDTSTVILAGGAGGVETGTIHGSNGAIPLSSGGWVTGGSGGGGGGGQSSGLVAGNGGNGGIPGGGGGGGGGSLNGTNSGAGGNGAQGRLIVVEFA